MINQYCMRLGFTKSLVALCVVMLLSACDGADDATPSNGDGSGSPVPGSVTIPGSPGSVTLSWTAPDQRADSAVLLLSEIAGYRIYYGTTSGIYPNSVDIPDRTVTDITVAGIPPGLYFFVMTTLDLDGRESAFSSPEIQIQI